MASHQQPRVYVYGRCGTQLSGRQLWFLFKSRSQHHGSSHICSPAPKEPFCSLLALFMGHTQLLDTCLLRRTLHRRPHCGLHLGCSCGLGYLPPSHWKMAKAKLAKRLHVRFLLHHCHRLHATQPSHLCSLHPHHLPLHRFQSIVISRITTF